MRRKLHTENFQTFIIVTFLIFIKVSEARSAVKFGESPTVEDVLLRMDQNVEIYRQKSYLIGALDSLSTLNQDFQTMIQSEYDLRSFIQMKKLFEPSDGKILKKADPLLFFFKYARKIQYSHYACAFIDLCLIVVFKIYLVKNLKALRGRSCCCSLEIFSKDLRTSVTKLAKYDVKNRHDDNGKRLLDNFNECPRHLEVEYMQEADKQRYQSNVCSSCGFIFLCFVLGYISVVIYAFVAVTSATSRDKLESENTGFNHFFTLVKEFPKKFEQKMSSRHLRLFSTKRPFIAALKDTKARAIEISLKSAAELRDLRSTCDLNFLEDLLDINPDFNPDIAERAKNTIKQNLRSVFNQYGNQLTLKINSLVEFFIDEQTDGYLFSQQQAINKGKGGNKKVPVSPKTKKAIEFLKKASQSKGVALIEEEDIELLIKDLNKFSEQVSENLLPQRQQFIKWCKRQSGTIFISQQEMGKRIDRKLEVAQHSLEKIINSASQYLTIPRSQLESTAAAVSYRAFMDLRKLFLPIITALICISLYIISSFVATCFHGIGSLFGISQYRIEVTSSLCMNTFNFFEILHPFVQIYLVGTVMMIQFIVESNYALWVPYFDWQGDSISNVLTRKSLEKILHFPSGSKIPPYRKKTVSQLREHCATHGFFDADWERLDLFKIYQKNIDAAEKKSFNRVMKFSHSEGSKIGKIGNIAALDTLKSKLDFFEEFYYHLTVLDELKYEQLKRSVIPSKALQFAITVSELRFMTAQFAEISSRLRMSNNMWQKFKQLSIEGNEGDQMNVEDYVDAMIQSKIQVLSKSLIHELKSFTLECKSIAQDINNMANEIENLFNTLYAVLILLQKAAQLLGTVHIFMILQMFIRNGLCTSRVLSTTDPISLATMKEIVYGFYK